MKAEPGGVRHLLPNFCPWGLGSGWEMLGDPKPLHCAAMGIRDKATRSG